MDIMPRISRPILLPACSSIFLVGSAVVAASSFSAEAISIATSMIAPKAPIMIALNMIAFRSTGSAGFKNSRYMESSSTSPVSCKKLSADALISAAMTSPPMQPKIVATVFLLMPFTSSRLVTTIKAQVRIVQQ